MTTLDLHTARLQELDIQHYQLADEIKELGRQLRELHPGRRERRASLIRIRLEKVRMLAAVNRQAAQLRKVLQHNKQALEQ